MNALQTFLASCNAQVRAIVQEAFTITGGDGTVYYGTFSDPQVMPIMNRQGYQDYLAVTMTAEASQFTGNPFASKKTTLTRTATGQVYLVNVVDYKGIVVCHFILTDRDL